MAAQLYYALCVVVKVLLWQSWRQTWLPTIPAALPERAAETLPFSPKPPARYGEIAKKLFTFPVSLWCN
jgi:hypothetical protein